MKHELFAYIEGLRKEKKSYSNLSEYDLQVLDEE